MHNILIPGRHLITSQFMVDYLESLLTNGIHNTEKIGEWSGGDRVDQIIVPVTSANQHGSRYNPVPFYARIIGLERTFAPFRERFGVHIVYVPVPHFRTTDDFASFTIKYVNAHLTDPVTAENTLVWISTKSLIDSYGALGYAVMPAEWDPVKAEYRHEPPNEILSALAEASESYTSIPAYELLSEATKSVWGDMPEIPEHIFRLFNDPILTDDGSLTEERNYATYAVGMSHTALMDVKFNDIKGAVAEGRIVDEGCADGALMVRLAEEFRDSDIIGIDITGEFISRVEERQRAGEFGGSFVHVYQRNLLQPIFAPHSVNTVICNSTLHELWSYGEQEKSVRWYLAEKFTELALGGRLVIRDVVGPQNKEDIVYLKLRTDDGETIDPSNTEALLTVDTATLSTHTCFYRFAHDFLHDLREAGRRDQSTTLQYEVVEIGGDQYFKLRLKDAVEFLSRKDYHDNWDSEMNEEFAFWDYEEWTAALEEAGFQIAHDNAAAPTFSRAYANDWIVENRWRSCATIYKLNDDGNLVEQPYPVTNMVLVGEKPVV